MLRFHRANVTLSAMVRKTQKKVQIDGCSCSAAQVEVSSELFFALRTDTTFPVPTSSSKTIRANDKQSRLMRRN